VTPVTYTPLFTLVSSGVPFTVSPVESLILAMFTNFYFRVTETLQSQIRFCSRITEGNPEPDAMLWKRC
jgi:hypothetical protein